MTVLSRIIVCLCALIAPAPLALATADVPLRVVTLNVLNGLNTSGVDFDAVGDMITTVDQNPMDQNTGLNPDVVCFQELNATSTLTNFRNQFLPGFSIYAPTSAGDGFNFNGILVAPGITVLDQGVVNVGGPRDVIFVVLDVPGSDEFVKVYCAHFKAFTDPGSQATRRNEANGLGQIVRSDLENGFVPGEPLENQHVIIAGDLNSNDNFDNTLDGIFDAPGNENTCCAPQSGIEAFFDPAQFDYDCSGPDPCCVTGPNVSQGLCNIAGGVLSTSTSPTGIVDVLFETILSGQFPGQGIISTFDNGFQQGRLDYVIANEELVLRFDTDMSGDVDVNEANAIGFVYNAADDVPGVHNFGQFANGNFNATNQASDHRPVVVTYLFTSEPTVGACCLPAGGCSLLEESACIGLSGAYQGDGALCSPDPCPPINVCEADLDNSGEVDFQDFLTLSAQFGGPGSADFDGSGTVDFQDFLTLSGEFGTTTCFQ
jgi:exonuclease III